MGPRKEVDTMISHEEEQKGYLEYEGVEFSAWCAFVNCNKFRDIYPQLSKSKKVKLAQNFYDHIFRVSDPENPVRFISKSVHTGGKICVDHCFSARVAHRAIMITDQWLLDDFSKFLSEFKWLTTKLGITAAENQKVKILPDGNGDVIVPKYIEERYAQEDGTPYIFWDKDRKDYVTDRFPVPVRSWYGEFEKSRIPANLKKFL